MDSLSKLEYLKRYMSKEEQDDTGTRTKKKKKKSTNPHATAGIVVIDNDMEARKLSSKSKKFEDDPYRDNEPTIAEIIDDTIPKGMQDSTKWKSITPREQSSTTKRPSPPLRRRIKQESPDPDFPTSSRRTTERAKRHDSGDDLSPARVSARITKDLSPPRAPRGKKVSAADGDMSPPRNRPRPDDDLSPERPSRRDNDISPRRRASTSGPSTSREEHRDSNRQTKTLSGRTAGLQNARTLREETDRKRREEDEMFRKMDVEISGRGATTVYRDRKTGKRRDFAEEDEEAAEKAARQKAHEEKFRKWGKGLVQQEKHDQAVQDALHEMAKPLARYENDKDRDALLKAQDREGDPMLEYLSKKRTKAPDGSKERPKYKGPPPHPNRFAIPPGYRWDGVDRSNGFEKERFKRQSNKIANASDAYKWSTEDM